MADGVIGTEPSLPPWAIGLLVWANAAKGVMRIAADNIAVRIIEDILVPCRQRLMDLGRDRDIGSDGGGTASVS